MIRRYVESLQKGVMKNKKHIVSSNMLTGVDYLVCVGIFQGRMNDME